MHAQVLAPVNPNGIGMANATVALDNSVSLFSNQAGLAGIENLTVSVAAEQRYLVAELKSASVGLALPTKSGTFALSAQTFGFDGFRQTKTAIAYGRKLGKNFSLGAQFDYLLLNIPEYGTKGIVTFEVGLQARLNSRLTIGAHTTSPAPVELIDGETLSSTLRVGIAWAVSERTTLASEVEKNIDFKPRWKTGLIYQPFGQFFLRTGFATEPSMLYVGVGYALADALKTDFAGSFHQPLGFSPAIGVEWESKKIE